MHLFEVKKAFDIFASQGREDERTEEGEADLAAVGMA